MQISRALVTLLALGLAVTGCASLEAGQVDAPAGSTTDTVATTEPAGTGDDAAVVPSPDSSGEALDASICTDLDADEFDPALLDRVPERHRDTLAGLEALSTPMEDADAVAIGAVLDTRPGLGDDMIRLADELGDVGCDADDVAALRGLGHAFTLWGAEPTTEYCDMLTRQFDDATASTEPDLGLVITDHSATWDRLLAIDEATEDTPDPDTIWQIFGDTTGLGLYAEGRCGVDGAYENALFGAAMLVAFGSGDLDADFTIGDDDELDADDDGFAFGEPLILERGPADPGIVAELETLAPPDGRITGFERVVVDLDPDDPGVRIATAIVPAGWEASGGVFGTQFDAPGDAGVGFFTEFELSTTCQGLCGPADDWPERFESFFFDPTFLLDEDLTAPDGRLVVTEGGITNDVIVGRWADGADQLLQCQAELDEEDEDLIGLFIELCRRVEASWLG